MNGVESFILTERVAPVQQSFYYTHPSFSRDGRFLWFFCGYPPEGGLHTTKMLGVVDFQDGEVRVFPETQFPFESAMVDASTGEAYWTNHLDVWKRGPHPHGKAVRVNSLPKDLAEGQLVSISTHPTFSSDRRSLNVDARFVQNDGTPVSIIGELPSDGSPFRLWQKITSRYFDHGLFSPTDPTVQLLAHEYWRDQARVEAFDENRKYHRMWTIRRGGEAAPLLKEPVTHSGHEWWDPDGRHVWYLHYGVGVKKASLETGEEHLIWPGALSHAHSSRDGRYLVADRMDHPGNPDCHVLFRDTITGKEVEIVNRGPLAPHLTKCTHLHPHPQFCFDDRYICHTTTIHDRVDVALVPVAGLINRTR